MTSLVSLTPDTFLLAPTAVSNDAGSGQLGAHLQSFNVVAPATEDSGFAFGNYVCVRDCDDVIVPPFQIPEPSVPLLLGIGLLGLWLTRRRSIG
jgi:hypothetical protein